MAFVADTEKLVGNIVRLRRAERFSGTAEDIAAVRRDLEAELGPTLSRSRAARMLGVSQTALDRWVGSGHVPTVVTPAGRKEIPARFVVELIEEIETGVEGQRHPLSTILRSREAAAKQLGVRLAEDAKCSGSAAPVPAGERPQGHESAERRALAFHRVVAERLNAGLVAAARERLERLRETGHIDPRYAERWEEILALPLSELAGVIVRDSQEARDLRQNTLFAGSLDELERRRIVELVR